MKWNKLMKLGLSLSVVTTALLTGCTANFFMPEKEMMAQETSAASMAQDKIVDSSDMPQFHTHSHLANYTDWIANQLMQQTTLDLSSQYIAVLPFTFSQPPATPNHQLTTELSEHVAHDLQSFGVKLLAGPTTMLNANQASEMAQKAGNGQATAYLTGTLIPTSHGIIVHAKLVDLSNNAMFASAEKFIPFYALSE